MPSPPFEYWWVALTGTIVVGILILGFLATLLVANRRLREERDFSDMILREDPAAIVVLDNSGHVLRANEEAARVLQSNGNRLSGVHFEHVPVLKKHLRSAWDRALHPRGAPVEFEHEVIGPGGKRREVAWTFSAIPGPHDQARWVIGIGLDLTEKKRLQELLFEAQKMEAIGRLAGGIAHDFNNMLTAIMGYCYTLEKRLPKDDRILSTVKEIDSTAEKAANLTKQLLALSRRQIFEPKRLELNEVVHNIRGMVKKLVGESVEIRFELGPDAGQIEADPTQVERVLINLVLNAKDAMPRGGKLRICTSQATADASFCRSHPPLKPGRYAVLTVEDTGIGMDRETLSHIFEPFFTTKPAGQGTGLGLATVYGIVQQLGGHIFVDSSPGKGTRFDIYLPRIDVPTTAVPQETVAEVNPPQLKGTVLVVEDDPHVRSLAAETLQEFGLTVKTAANGRDALRAICSLNHGLDLLITDVVMPQMSGREVAERLCASNPKLKVLYMSSYPEDAIRQHGVLEKHATLLQKPFSPEELIRTVTRVLQS